MAAYDRSQDEGGASDLSKSVIAYPMQKKGSGAKSDFFFLLSHADNGPIFAARL